MLFGCKDNFAIEALTEPELELPSAVWGRMCLWSEGTMIGNIAEPFCALYPSATALRKRVQVLDSLWADEFHGLTDTEIFDRFDQAIYSSDDQSVQTIVRNMDLFWKFDFLTNWGEQFDPLKGFLARPPDGDILMIIQLADYSLLSRRIDPDLFVAVASAFIDWFDLEACRLNETLPLKS